MTDLEKILAIVAACTTLFSAVGGVPGILTFLKRGQEARKADAETDETLAKAASEHVETSLELLGQYKAEYKRVQQRLDKISEEYLELLAKDEQEIEGLRQEIKELNRRMDDLEAEVKKWKQAYISLCQWVRRQGLEPPEMVK